MVFPKFVALVAFVLFNISFANGNTEIFYNKLREQAATCEEGKTYEVKADGCRSSCACVAIGVMKCDENECERNGDGVYTEKEDSKKLNGITEESESTQVQTMSIFEKLRDDATTCKEGQEVYAYGCGKCTCVLTGILNCKIKAGCLPNNNKHRRQEVSNVIIG